MLGSAPLPDFVHRLHMDAPPFRSSTGGPAPERRSVASGMRWSHVLKLCFWLGVILIVWCF